MASEPGENGNGSRSYWITIGGAIAAFAAIGTAIVAPIYASIAELRQDIREITDKQLTKAEHTEFKAHIDDKILSVANDETRGIADIRDRISAQGERINQIQKEFGSNFTLGDAVKDLQRQLSELRVKAPEPYNQTTKP